MYLIVDKRIILLSAKERDGLPYRYNSTLSIRSYNSFGMSIFETVLSMSSLAAACNEQEKKK